MGEEVTYITNPKPNYGFKTGTNIPRELYKEEVERINRSYKNYKENGKEKEKSRNSPRTNEIDHMRISWGHHQSILQYWHFAI